MILGNKVMRYKSFKNGKIRYKTIGHIVKLDNTFITIAYSLHILRGESYTLTLKEFDYHIRTNFYKTRGL